MATKQNLFLDALLDDEMTKRVTQELGIQDSPPGMQADMLSRVGMLMQERVALEILSVLPESEHDTFEAFIGSGDVDGMRSFLEKYIPDLDRFMMRYARLTFDGLKSRIHRLKQGVE